MRKGNFLLTSFKVQTLGQLPFKVATASSSLKVPNDRAKRAKERVTDRDRRVW